MKNKEQIEAEIEKVILEMQEIGGEDEGWDTRNGWVNALRWTLKEGEDTDDYYDEDDNDKN